MPPTSAPPGTRCPLPLNTRCAATGHTRVQMRRSRVLSTQLPSANPPWDGPRSLSGGSRLPGSMARRGEGQAGAFKLDVGLSCGDASRVMNAIKGRSSNRLMRNFRELNRQFWGRHLWARGYFVADRHPEVALEAEASGPGQRSRPASRRSHPRRRSTAAESRRGTGRNGR